MAERGLRRRISLLWNVDETVDRVNTTLDRFDGTLNDFDGTLGRFAEPKLAGGLRQGETKQDAE